MHIGEEFFKEEERCGFIVPKIMKHCWAAEMEVLSDIDRVCRKYGLEYYVYFGTMLGAIRHKGFIPWDDDIDIAMKRSDYDKFKRIAPSELSKRSMVMSWDVGRFRSRESMVVYNTEEKFCFDQDFLDKYHGYYLAASVDIFCLDYVTRDKQKLEFQELLLKHGWALFYSLERGANLSELKEGIDWLSEVTGIEISYKENELGCSIKESVQLQLLGIMDTIAAISTEEESDELTYFKLRILRNPEYRFDKGDWSKVEYMPFENMMLPVPVGYENILRMDYGDDYNVYKQGTAEHEYPRYKDDIILAKEWMKEHDYIYDIRKIEF